MKKIEIILDEVPGRTALVAEEGTMYYENRKLAEEETGDITVVEIKTRTPKAKMED